LNGLLPTLINPKQGLNNEQDVLHGAGHVLAEMIAETADIRAVLRAVLWDTGRLQTTKSEKLPEGQGLEYKDYFEFMEPIRQIPRELSQRAEGHAVTVFARNLRSKLRAAPLRGKRVLAIDPAFRTGCKLAVLSETGEPIADAVVFPHPPQNRKNEAKAKLEE